MFEWLKKIFDPGVSSESKAKDREKQLARQGMVTITCRKCGKTITLPEDVQHWPDYCQECMAKYRPVETITRKCRGCGRYFTFKSNVKHWPNYCYSCQAKRKRA